MTGQDIQTRLDAIVTDLQTTQRGKSTQIAFRDSADALSIFPLSSDINGVVDAAQLAAIDNFLTNVKTFANDYEAAYTPVRTASTELSTARQPHQANLDAATSARQTANTALAEDATYQTALANYEAARNDAAFLNARNGYQNWNVSENYNNLQDARGNYV